MSEEILNPSTSTGLTLNESVKADLLSAAKWAKFLCIVSCIGLVIMVLAAFTMMFVGSVAGQLLGDLPVGPAMGLFYLLIAAIYIYPIIKGFQFANGAKAACLSNDEYQLARAISGLRSLLQFCGILAIICITIYAFILLIGLILGSAVALRG